jgi:hypothetical protein
MSLRRKLLAFLKSQKKNTEYTELEWIGNEENCYIFFPLVTAGKDIIELEYEAQFTRTDVAQAEGKNKPPYFFMGLQNSVWYAGCGEYGNSSVKADTEWHHFRLVSYGDDNGFWLDGTRIYQSTPQDGVYLPQGFRLWIGQGGTRTTYNRKKYVKVKVNGKLVYDLIPVLDKDFIPCLYDKISGSFFYNQGSGEFKWKLPNQLEYLESTDNQYIDTLLPVTENTGALIDAEWVYENTSFSTLSGSYQSFMVMGVVPSSRRICYSYNSDPKGTTTYPLKDGTTIPSSEVSSVDSSKFITENGRFQVGLNYLGSRKWTYKTASESYETDLGETVVQNDQTLTLFCRRYSTTPQESNSYFWKGKIYSAIYTDGDKIVQYLVPAFDENLNVCMYDLVSKEYFRNKGTGSFKGYFENGSRLVNYLSATGTQWIDTGITPLIGDEIELKNVLCKKKSSGMQAIFSAGTGNYQTVLLVADNSYPTRGAFYKYFATGGAQNVNEPYFLNDLTKIKVDGEGNIYYNDEFIVQSPPVQETDSSLRLFYRANDSSPMTGNIGAASIKRDGKFVINLVSVIKSDGTACMYDLVSGKYLVNQGTGIFNYG